MKMKNLIVAICAIIMPLSSCAAIDLLSIVNQTGPLNSGIAKNLLSCCYLHNPNLLNKSTVNVDEIKQINGNTVFLCSIKNESLPTEYYIATINNRHGLVVDGVMLGHNGDSRILAIEDPRGEMRYAPKPELEFEFNGDTVKVVRHYDFFSTMRGGRTFEKYGTIITPFLVATDGKISRLNVTTKAIQRIGDANYLSKDHKLPVTEQTTGEFYPPGMQVLEIEQQPASSKINAKNINGLATEKMKIIERYGEKFKENSETLSVIEFGKWTFNQGMRDSNEFLTWIAENSNTENFTHFIEACASDNNNGELQWLKDKVDSLKNKKARKWWQKWIKNNL